MLNRHSSNAPSLHCLRPFVSSSARLGDAKRGEAQGARGEGEAERNPSSLCLRPPGAAPRLPRPDSRHASTRVDVPTLFLARRGRWRRGARESEGAQGSSSRALVLSCTATGLLDEQPKPSSCPTSVCLSAPHLASPPGYPRSPRPSTFVSSARCVTWCCAWASKLAVGDLAEVEFGLRL